MHRRLPKVRRRGFTLLEILLALGLMLLLVAAISQAMNTYIALSTLGREEVEQAQIGRALLQQMAKDIRSISWSPVPEEDLGLDPEGGGEVAAEDGDLPDDEFADEIEPEAAPVETGILGTSDELILYVNQPDRRMNYVAPEDALSAKDRVSDARTVYYYLARTGGGSGVSSEFASEVAPGSDRDVVGLARLDGDRDTINAALADNDTDPQVEASNLIAEEVVNIEFRYYSAGEWLEEWDSMESNTLPQAIEIKVHVQLQNESVRTTSEGVQNQFKTARELRDEQNENEENVIRVYRRVVSIPLVPPVEPDEAL